MGPLEKKIDILGAYKTYKIGCNFRSLCQSEHQGNRELLEPTCRLRDWWPKPRSESDTTYCPCQAAGCESEVSVPHDFPQSEVYGKKYIATRIARRGDRAYGRCSYALEGLHGGPMARPDCVLRGRESARSAA